MVKLGMVMRDSLCLAVFYLGILKKTENYCYANFLRQLKLNLYYAFLFKTTVPYTVLLYCTVYTLGNVYRWRKEIRGQMWYLNN